MHRRLLDILVCPTCQGNLRLGDGSPADENIETGTLTCDECATEYPIIRGIPRFVPQENYSSSFGFQWNVFKFVQIDKYNATNQSERRFYSETEWTPEWMAGKLVLDVGCGAGRFLEVSSRTSAEVVGVDLSNAVDAAQQVVEGRGNVHLVQASVYQLPFRRGTFDACYCIGVVQHTPEPPKTLSCLAQTLKPGGRLAVTIYERRRWTMLNAKYWVRPLTAKLKKETLLFWIRGLMPVVFPVTEVLYRVPLFSKVFRFVIPVANYVEEKQFDLKQRYRMAILDTFDMLAPAYDQPMTQAEAEAPLRATGIKGLRRTNNRSLNLIGEKQPTDVDITITTSPNS